MVVFLEGAIDAVTRVYLGYLSEAMVPSDLMEARMELVRGRNIARGYLRDVLMTSGYPSAVCDAFADDLTKSFSQGAIFRNTETTVAGSRERLAAEREWVRTDFTPRIQEFFDMPRDYVLAMYGDKG